MFRPEHRCRRRVRMSHHPGGRRFIPRRPWQPLADAEWAALAPYLRDGSGPGRPLGTDPRARMDAFLQVAVADLPWRLLPEAYGKGSSVARHFRRLAHAGLWARLLEALARPHCPPALRAVETGSAAPRAG